MPYGLLVGDQFRVGCPITTYSRIPHWNRFWPLQNISLLTLGADESLDTFERDIFRSGGMSDFLSFSRQLINIRAEARLTPRIPSYASVEGKIAILPLALVQHDDY